VLKLPKYAQRRLNKVKLEIVKKKQMGETLEFSLAVLI